MRRYFRCISSLLVLLFYLGIHASYTDKTHAAQDPAGRDAVSFTFSGETSGTFALDSITEESDSYRVRGRTIRLWRSARQMVVKFNDESADSLFAFADQPAEQNAALQSILQVPASEIEVSMDRQLPQGIFILNASPTDATSLLRSRIEAFGALPNVAYAHPLFFSEQGSHALVLTDEILVRFSPGFSEQDIQDFCRQNGLMHLRRSAGGPDVRVLRLIDPKARSPLETVNVIAFASGVLWAEPNFLTEVKFQTVDPLFDSQWHLHNTGQGGGVSDADVDGPEAWAELGSGGSPDIAIAIIDSGVDLDHEDLAIWQNPGETGNGRETNGIDDDGNGYVDDYRGWDFFSADNDPGPGGSHGTACAGVAAAIGDNDIGVAGIAHGSRILPIKISEADSNFASYEQLGLAIVYAADLADVISCSWSTAEDNYIMDAIDYAVTEGRGGLGCPVFFAAGNSAASDWRTLYISGAPAGTNIFRLVYSKDEDGEAGTGRVWVDNVTLQDGTFENFNGVTPPALPAGWTTSGDANWTTVAPPDPVIGGTGNSLRSGSIGPDEYSFLDYEKTYAESGTYMFSFRHDASIGGQFATQLRSSTWGGWSNLIIISRYGIGFPASYANSIAVGASSNLDLRSSYSQYGLGLDFVAPSNGGTLAITTTDRTGVEGYSSTNYTSTFGGTSSATPLAAGVAALILSNNPTLTEEDVKAVMRSSCDQIGGDPYDETEWNQYYGYGRVNAYNALELLSVPLLRFSESSFAVAENGMNATITVSRIGNLSGEVSVQYTTADGTATAGTDYGAVSGILVFPDGDDTPKTITISIYNDIITETDETVIISLTNPTGDAVVAVPHSAVLTILDQRDFYVNDGSTVNDQWCTAPGDDMNDGLTPATPKATIQSVIDTYDLDEGDTVHIDTGTYTLTDKIDVTEVDGGSSRAPVVFEASPYGVTIDRNSTSSGSYAWHLNRSDYVTIRTASGSAHPGQPERPMAITGGYYGIYVYYANRALIQGVEIYNNSNDGICMRYSNYGVLANNLIHGNSDEGIYIYVSDYSTVVNNTIATNEDNQIELYNANYPILKNNIVWADAASNYGINFTSPSPPISISDYNLIYATNGADVGYYNSECTTLNDWQTATGGDSNSLSLDPLFVNMSGGDYHLTSDAGSYHGGQWLPDGTYSPGIDAGDPMDNAGAEPAPNSNRVNLGAYGGTRQASLSLDSDLDGLGDAEEDINGNGIWDAGETNPFDDDTDDDGLKDGEEKAYWGFDWNSDIDGDGLINILDIDSDGDGWSDGEEVQRGTDPGDADDKPGTSLPWIQPLLLGD